MQLVEDDALERAEQERRVVGGEQQRKLLGRGEQDVGRIAPLTLPLRDRRVAGARLEPDRQSHLGDRALEVARDVDRERLEWRDVEGVQAARAADATAGGDEFLAYWRRRGAAAQLHQRRQKPRQRLAGAGRRDQQRGTARARKPQQFELMRARRPAARGKPAREDLGQFGGSVEHVQDVSPAARLVIGTPAPAAPEPAHGFPCAKRRASVRSGSAPPAR